MTRVPLALVASGLHSVLGIMSHIGRWFAVLGVAVVLPAAALLGATGGELLRDPAAGLPGFLRVEGPVVGLGVIATLLFTTASGLGASRRWARWLAMGESAAMILLGIVLLVANARLLRWIGAPEVLAIFLITAGMAAVLLGARLLHALRRVADAERPISRADLRSLGGLGVVVLAGALGHLFISGFAI